MEAWDFILENLTETIKYSLISYGILGFQFRRNYAKWVIILCSLIIAGIATLRQGDVVIIEIAYRFIVLSVLFKGNVKIKIQAFILQYFAIAAVDLLIWSIFVLFLGNKIYDGLCIQHYIKWASEILGCFFWGVLGLLLKNQRSKMKESFENSSFLYFTVVLIALLGLAFMAGMAQFNLMEKTGGRLQGAYLIISSAILVLFILFIYKYMYTVYLKKQLEIENAFTVKYIELQKSYYEKAIENDENIRRFKHDIVKHISVMDALCRSNEIQGLKEYIRDIDAKYVDAVVQVDTGNIVADYFINQTVSELKKQGNIKFEIIGRFPEKIVVSNSDLCILFGNAMENALEALKKVEGDRKLTVNIRNIHNHIFMSIANSTIAPENKDLKTTKKNREYHGYGIGNMIKVVESYGGNITFEIKDNMFVVDIDI